MRMGQCKNCAWYCHADGMCYGTVKRLYGAVSFVDFRDERAEACEKWSFDGLEDWERAEYERESIVNSQ